jgi:hypothetical protein
VTQFGVEEKKPASNLWQAISEAGAAKSKRKYGEPRDGKAHKNMSTRENILLLGHGQTAGCAGEVNA